MNADSVVETIRKSQGIVRESNQFLGKLYNAKDSNLWYRPLEDDELYVNFEPDYRQVLRKRYGEKIAQLRDVSEKASKQECKVKSI